MASRVEKVSKYICIIVSIIGLQSIAIYDGQWCRNQNGLKNANKCKLIEKAKLNYPASFLIENYTNLRKVLSSKTTSGMVVLNLNESRKRFKDSKSGFTFNYPKGSRDKAGYILMAHGDSNKDGEPLLELWDLNEQELIYKWNLNMNEINNYLRASSNQDIEISNSVVFSNPLILNDGNIITTKDNGFLIKLSPDGKVNQINSDYFFHHSLEIDKQGYIYSPIRIPPKNQGEFPDEGFAILDQELNILKSFSLSKIFQDSGLNYKIYSKNPTLDPFHLNDVAPLLNEEKSNVVLLSLRSMSSIIAFNIDTEKIIWKIEGYFNRQHDVDILDNKGSHITIFDNNIEKGYYTNGNNFITIKNLESSTKNDSEEMFIYSYPSRKAIDKELIIKKEDFSFLEANLIPITEKGGQSEYIIDNNSVFIEETNNGRSFEYDVETKKILWQYINRDDSNNLYYQMSWARRIKDLPPSLLEDVKKAVNPN